MLETYFVKPQTVDRVRGLWIGPEIEHYVVWLAEHGYGARTVLRRVPLLAAFGEFARLRGARTVADLPAHVDAFVAERVAEHRGGHGGGVARRDLVKEVRGPIEHMLGLVVGGTAAGVVPGGARRPGTRKSPERSATKALSTMRAAGALETGAGLAKSTVRDACGVLRVFLRYAHREGLVASDLSATVEWPQVYRLSSIPRSISWAEVGQVLAGVDRRTPCGKRDYAILLLLVTYGLRGREVAALTLDDIDWKRQRLAIPERKAGHSTAFPLSTAVGEALVDYLRHGRPGTADRHVFFRAMAPLLPIGAAAVSGCARRYLLKAGVEVPRPGSHTLRHTAVQRLVDADFSLKAIGDFVGHRSAKSTEVYAKAAVESLRQVALGDGEEVLG